jgi:hypothetical protein
MLATVSDDVTLEALGIPLEEEELSALRSDCVPVAQRIAHAQKKVVGLLPASADIGVLAVALQLGLSLVEVAHATVAYVDANVRWPAISSLAMGRRPDDDETMFATRWLRGQLALLTPQPGVTGGGVQQLAGVIQHSLELFAHILVDLTGFRKLGEHLDAIEMMDAVVVVARAGRTREDELLLLDHELPPELNLGVLLAHARLPPSA